jgi:hypothetical protein
VLLDLAADVHLEGAVGCVDYARTLDGSDRVNDRGPVFGVTRANGDVADQVLVGLNELDRTDRSAHIADRAGNAPEHSGDVFDLDSDRQAVLG